AKDKSIDERSLAILALARISGAEKMVKWLDDSDLGHVAGYALAMLPGDAATTAIETALASAKGKTDAAGKSKLRLVARAAIIRYVAIGKEAAGLSDVLATMATSSDDADLDTSAFGRVALGQSIDDVLGDTSNGKSPKPALVSGAGRAALLR